MTSLPEISQGQEHSDAGEYDAGPVHRLSVRHWVTVREHVQHVEDQDVCTRRSHDNVSDHAFHPEWSGRDVLSGCENMGQDSRTVRHGREDCEAGHKRIERCRRSDVDTAEDSAANAADDLCVEGVSPGWRDVSDEFWERGGFVAAESPEHAAGRDPGAWDRDDDIDAEEKEECKCACVGSRGLLEHSTERKGRYVGVVDIVKGGYAVELSPQ